MNKTLKRLTSALLVAALSMSMAVSAFAATTVEKDATVKADATPGSENVIPVTISAEPTVLDVDIPTTLPTAKDPETGETVTPTDVTITNNSAGAIVVSKITAKDNAAYSSETGFKAWKLADFTKDMTKAKVDSNLIGLSVTPVKEGTEGTALKTTDANTATQELLAAANDEWVMNAKKDGDTSNVLKIKYATNISPVSTKIENVKAAQLIFVVSWNTAE